MTQSTARDFPVIKRPSTAAKPPDERKRRALRLQQFPAVRIHHRR